MKQLSRIVTVTLMITVAALVSPHGMRAQDPLRVDSTRTKLIFENDQVRVFRVTYAPHKKGVMHSHPDGVAVFLTDADLRFAFPDGNTIERKAKTGQAVWLPATTHLVENVGKKRAEMIHVELKSLTKTR